MSAAPELVERAHDVVERLSAAIHDGGSAAYLQLICSELFEALQLELGRAEVSEQDKRQLLASALDLCKQSGDPKLKADLRLAHLRAIVALLKGASGTAPQAVSNQPRYRVIQGGLA